MLYSNWANPVFTIRPSTKLFGRLSFGLLSMRIFVILIFVGLNMSHSEICLFGYVSFGFLHVRTCAIRIFVSLDIRHSGFCLLGLLPWRTCVIRILIGLEVCHSDFCMCDSNLCLFGHLLFWQLSVRTNAVLTCTIQTSCQIRLNKVHALGCWPQHAKNTDYYLFN